MHRCVLSLCLQNGDFQGLGPLGLGIMMSLPPPLGSSRGSHYLSNGHLSNGHGSEEAMQLDLGAQPPLPPPRAGTPQGKAVNAALAAAASAAMSMGPPGRHSPAPPMGTAEGAPKPLIAGLDLSNGSCPPPPAGPGRGGSLGIEGLTVMLPPPRTGTPSLLGPAYVPGRTSTPALPPSNLSGLPRPATPAAASTPQAPSLTNNASIVRTGTPGMGHAHMLVLPVLAEHGEHLKMASSLAPSTAAALWGLGGSRVASPALGVQGGRGSAPMRVEVRGQGRAASEIEEPENEEQMEDFLA